MPSSSPTSPTPDSIKVDRSASQVIIVWDDGLRCVYPFSFLREHCPSAPAKAERAKSSSSSANAPNAPGDAINVLSSAPNYEVANARLVGNYALQFQWADGHAAGLYTYTYLRQLADDPLVQTSASS